MILKTENEWWQWISEKSCQTIHLIYKYNTLLIIKVKKNL